MNEYFWGFVVFGIVLSSLLTAVFTDWGALFDKSHAWHKAEVKFVLITFAFAWSMAFLIPVGLFIM